MRKKQFFLHSFEGKIKIWIFRLTYLAFFEHGFSNFLLYLKLFLYFNIVSDIGFMYFSEKILDSVPKENECFS